MKRLFLLLVASFVMLNVVAVEKIISPTACGITVGQTTKTGKTFAEWGDILKDYRPMNVITTEANQQVYLGDFVVEGFHMSLLNMELINDTVYQLSFYEKSPYADCWDSYKDLAFKLRDKYAHFEDVTEPVTFDTDSAVMIYKTDGKTQILFAAYPNSISLTLTNVHFHEIWMHSLYEGLNTILSGKTGPNYDEKNKVSSIAGVRFGETRTNTINAFKQRGTFLRNEDKKTYFSDVTFGGSTYSVATLFFQYDSRRKDLVFSAAKFEKNFYEWRKEEAVMMYEVIVSNFKAKYTNCLVLFDEPDKRVMVCGMLDDQYDDGKMPPIVVSMEMGVSRGGDKFYYVTVSYFEQRMNSADTDDI